ncbi:MAG: ABC transporter substrate-binding protein [Dehalococcoidales bacterium]|nr:ABC transporter substrate-binding protein [Dehalococcoidales bacterium]
MISSILLVTSCSEQEPQKEDIEETHYADPTIPKYGGIHHRIRNSNWNSWDYAEPPYMLNISLMGEELLGGDWAKGPAGTGENDWTSGYGGFTDMLTGRLAEDWEMPDNETIVYHIRQGVHWWNRPPANGRELTAEDVVWNIERHFSSEESFNYAAYTQAGKAPLSVTATGDYTVEIKVIPEYQGITAAIIGDSLWMLCPDAVEANGGEPLISWQQFIGTGPFMITKYEADSYVEYVRNPDYWQTDPLHPENQLPYADGMKEIILHYSATYQVGNVKAAFRTGQADMIATTLMTLPGWEELETLQEEFPELKVKSFAGPGIFMIWPRLDNTKLPFSDIRIRYAMNLAVNQQELVDDYYGGHADLFAWPYADLPVFDRIYTPLEEQSQIVQDLFGYDVERARELMKEADYPNGFEFTLYSNQTDFLMIIKEYLNQINIDMKVDYMNEVVHRTHDDSFFGYTSLLKPQEMLNMVEGSLGNYSRVSDARIQEAYEQLSQLFGTDDAGVAEILKELGPYELELAIPIYLPAAQAHAVWWPWLQNFYGAVGGGGNANIDEYLMYFWLDTDMKAAMGQ